MKKRRAFKKLSSKIVLGLYRLAVGSWADGAPMTQSISPNHLSAKRGGDIRSQAEG